MKRFTKIISTTLLLTSISLSATNVLASESQIVKLSVGSSIANVNGKDVKLSDIPYIQTNSNSMMIPLRFVSTALGIPENNISYNPNTKEITIKYNDINAIFKVGSNQVTLKDGKKNLTNNTKTITEVVNSKTFIPLRALETAFNFKIEWKPETKTAILSNPTKENTTITTQLNNSNLETTTIVNPTTETTTLSQTQKPTVVETSTETTTQSPIVFIEVTNSNTSTKPTSYSLNDSKKELTQEQIKAMEEEVVRLLNQERAKQGLNPLQISDKLMQLSEEKAKDMYDNNYFEHISPDLGTPAEVMTKNNINFGLMAENIAKDYGTPEDVVNAWMHSPGHRKNILTPTFNYIGVGFYNNYWAQQFADKLN